MFSTKKESLFDVKKKTSSVNTNEFISNGVKMTAETLSGNGALKYSSTGNRLLDQFGSISNYRVLRSFEEISNDMRMIYSENKEKTLALTLYIRMVTRTISYFDGTTSEIVQKGQGLRHESILRMIWIAINDPKVFWENLHLFISAGSWKDIIQMLSYDIQYHGWENRQLDWDKFSSVIIGGLENEKTSNLVKKYLPSIRANGKCITVESQADNIIAKFICGKIFGKKDERGVTYKKYRKLKSSGTAHEWQKLISKKLLNEINFNTIHGRALSLLVSGKFLKNNNLEDVYENWIESQPIAKYTGFVYELLAPVKKGYKNCDLKGYRVNTINKQFMGLIELAKKDTNTDTRFICALDTSSSMTTLVRGLKYSSYDVAKSVALYFSYLLEGTFSKFFFQFSNGACLKKWVGATPVERLQNDHSEAYGGTDFLGIARDYSNMKSNGVPESDFPNGVIAISDGEFNRVGVKTTNVKEFKRELSIAGFSKDFCDNFTFVFWDIPNNYHCAEPKPKFETFEDHKNVFYMSGFDPSGITFLLGGTTKNGVAKAVPTSADELMEVALSQEIMQRIKIS